jgi:hypothetical protein
MILRGALSAQTNCEPQPDRLGSGMKNPFRYFDSSPEVIRLVVSKSRR